MTTPFRRKVLYLPGYDPFPPRRYRELYRREGADQAKISGYRLDLVKRTSTDGFGWAAQTRIGDRDALADIEVLVWADLVQGSMGHGILATYGQLCRTAWAYIASGALWRLMKLRRGPVIAALYPIVILVVQLIVALAVGMFAASFTSGLIGNWSILIGIAVTIALLIGFKRIDRKIFAYYLMHDYAFTAALGGAYPPALEHRIDQFRARMVDALAEDWDEVLVVGHSSGAYLAVSVLADLVRAGQAPDRSHRLALLTLGQVVPMASFLPDADRLRADLACLAGQDHIFWLDVTAPGDACCFALCDPVAVSGMADAASRWPLVISAAFTQTLSPERQRALRGHWFRIHFQYLCAFDRPGDYDYFAITAGAQHLAQRFAGRGHSPGRITRAAGRTA